MAKTVFVTYVPQAGAPQNMPAQFPITGWGHLTLAPFPEVTELALNLAEILLGRCPNRVFLAHPSEIKKLSKKFTEGRDNLEIHLVGSSKIKVNQADVKMPVAEVFSVSSPPPAPITEPVEPVSPEKNSKKNQKETEK
jgi:hypothetical protein